MNRDLFRRLYLLALPVALVAVSHGNAGSNKKQTPRPVWKPDPTVEGAPRLEGTTWIGELPGWTVWLKQLDGDERVQYIAGQTGLSIDPFATRPDEMPTYLSFLLVLENRNEEDIHFNPMNGWLKTSRDQIKTPIGLADLEFDYRSTGRELPPAYNKVAPTLLVSPLTVRTGEKISGLLVYPMIEPRSKKFVVTVQVTLNNGDESSLSAPYLRVKTKE